MKKRGNKVVFSRNLIVLLAILFMDFNNEINLNIDNNMLSNDNILIT